MPLTVGSLFSGIGGFDLGLERAGMTVRWQVENDSYCNRVLRKHWPRVVRYGDIRGVDWRTVEPVDLVCGGFPCQPVSVAGKRRGQADERWLWPEFARCLGILRPRYVLIENVPGLLVRGFADVLRDLAACGYDANWDCLPASAVGAPHRRDRVWIVAYARQHQSRSSQESRTTIQTVRGKAKVFTSGCREDAADARCVFQKRLPISRETEGTGAYSEFARCSQWDTEPDVGRVAHGVPYRVDRLRGLGNAVVPQVVEWLGRRILAADGQ
jgi:DNA (cytosine-5)-methyltransferase 1